MTSQLLSKPRSLRALSEPQAPSLAHLVFLVDSQSYACPAKDIAHLLLRADARVLPNPEGVPAWEVGRLDTEGAQNGIPIISLRLLWGLPPEPEASLSGKQTLLVVLPKDEPCALLVDTCQCVLPSLPPHAPALEIPAALTGASGSAFKAVVRWKDTLLVITDINQLMPGRLKPTPGPELSRPKS